MLKHLIGIIEDLGLNSEEFDKYSVVSTLFREFDERKNKFIRIDMPENENDFDESKKHDRPIYEIIKDDSDPELCLITKYLPEKEDAPTEPLLFSYFYSHIKQLNKKYSKYEVLSSAWERLDEEHTGRFDRPIVAVLVDQENERVCMVEMGPDENE